MNGRSRDRLSLNAEAVTPAVGFDVSINGSVHRLWLKLESYNPYDSIKSRTAYSLWQDVANEVDPNIGIIESTSGNLGVALAAIAAEHDVPFTAVVDIRSSGSVVETISALGGRVKVIDRPDGTGGYLLNRLRYIKAQIRARPRLIWTNQYANPANPRAHALGTAPELRAQIPEPACVLVAVSTGGTLAGFRDYVAEANPDWELIGVDVNGSVALGGASGERPLPGIGSSRRSEFLAQGYRPTVRVTSTEAVSACLWLMESAGIGVGASSGALVAAALRLLRADPRRRSVVCVCADGPGHYLDTVYSSRWREVQRLDLVDVARGVEIVPAEIAPAETPIEIAPVDRPPSDAEVAHPSAARAVAAP
ncbi:pyridoxal-phosphate dependent enzyme [Actinomadura fulvescens]|uniref:Tryptophan synthase beta chain-like PALP domain-containing protein n=1 Tax=Actinomadura fulvescens TaxID=46160 RepID=A0ABN3QWP8_9ACTN